MERLDTKNDVSDNNSYGSRRDFYGLSTCYGKYLVHSFFRSRQAVHRLKQRALEKLKKEYLKMKDD